MFHEIPMSRLWMRWKYPWEDLISHYDFLVRDYLRHKWKGRSSELRSKDGGACMLEDIKVLSIIMDVVIFTQIVHKWLLHILLLVMQRGRLRQLLFFLISLLSGTLRGNLMFRSLFLNFLRTLGILFLFRLGLR